MMDFNSILIDYHFPFGYSNGNANWKNKKKDKQVILSKMMTFLILVQAIPNT